jgi:hypothetical protein
MDEITDIYAELPPMAPQSHDFISRLHPNAKLPSIAFLPGKDAANLRLTPRTWRYIAAEGLFNVFKSRMYVGSLDGFVTQGKLAIRPWRSYRSIADGLIEWPWMARHIQEIEIYLPDQELGSLVAAADIHESLRENPDAPWDFPKESFLELGREFSDVKAEAVPLNEMFSRLPHVESLSIFSERCSFPQSESCLSAFGMSICVKRNPPWNPLGTNQHLQSLLRILLFDMAHHNLLI